MITIKVFIVLCMILLSKKSFAFFDPVSIGVGIGALGFGSMNFNFIKDQTYCRLNECCNDRNIPADIDRLYENLTHNLFGQHIVIRHLIPALKAHFSKNNKAKKPLVISFHGTPGTGKNLVADQIAEALYKYGLNSKYVHKYLGRADFPQDKDTYYYKTQLNKDVREAIKECPRSLFIFDEVDKMPSGVFESLTSLVGYNTLVNGVDYSQAIFLFLSNTAGVHISDRLGNLIKSGTLREHTKLSDFEQILEKASYNLDGGLYKTSLIETHVIDHYLPFLPLEKAHIYKCIQVELNRWNEYPDKQLIEQMIEQFIIYERTHNLFATSGCKTLEKKVALTVISKRSFDVETR